jgi:hypothetical protein
MWQPGLQFGWASFQLLADVVGHGQVHECGWEGGKATR